MYVCVCVFICVLCDREARTRNRSEKHMKKETNRKCVHDQTVRTWANCWLPANVHYIVSSRYSSAIDTYRYIIYEYCFVHWSSLNNWIVHRVYQYIHDALAYYRQSTDCMCLVHEFRKCSERFFSFVSSFLLFLFHLFVCAIVVVVVAAVTEEAAQQLWCI